MCREAVENERNCIGIGTICHSLFAKLKGKPDFSNYSHRVAKNHRQLKILSAPIDGCLGIRVFYSSGKRMINRT